MTKASGRPGRGCAPGQIHDALAKPPLCAAAPRLPDCCGLYLALVFHDSSARQILTTMSLAYVGAHAGHLDGRIMGAIHDWATPENLQPEPITVEIGRDLPDEFCRQVEVVNGQAVRCEAPRRTHQAAARRLAAVLEAAAADYVAMHPVPAWMSVTTSTSSSGRFPPPRSGDRTSRCATAHPTTCDPCRPRTSG